MTKTIFITGASSGIGKTTAKLFQQKGWNVVATMRSPAKETELTALDNILVTRLDVTDPASITAAVAQAIDRFGKIDVLLNNAGFGAYGPLEGTPIDKIRLQFDTNVIGVLETTKAVIPHFRAAQAGVLINVASMGGKVTFPLGALYHGTKFAVEGLSEALTFEMAAIGVKVKIIEPGMIDTDFGGRSFNFNNEGEIPAYQDVVQKVMAGFQAGGAGSDPSVVAAVIYQAATDGTDQLRYVAGADAKALLAKRKSEDDVTFLDDMRRQFKLDQ